MSDSQRHKRIVVTGTGIVGPLGCGVPPTLKLGEPCERAERLDLVALSARRMSITHALSNGFGFGGVNASVLFRRWETTP